MTTTSTLATAAATAPRASLSRRPSRAAAAMPRPRPRGVSAIARAKKVKIPAPDPDAPTPLSEEQLARLPEVMLEKDPWDGDVFEKLGDVVKNWGLFFVVVFAVGAGVVAANTYNDGAVGVDFQAYDEPGQAVYAAMKGAGVGNAGGAGEAPKVMANAPAPDAQGGF